MVRAITARDRWDGRYARAGGRPMPTSAEEARPPVAVGDAGTEVGGVTGPATRRPAAAARAEEADGRLEESHSISTRRGGPAGDPLRPVAPGFTGEYWR